jgi:HPt (histidine-containing phosphotransfer) domain-containing protein
VTAVNSNSSRGDKSAAAAAGVEAISLARIDRLRSSMPGKESVVREMVDLFVADLPGRLGAIRDAIDRADARALAPQAHALRGSAANFGAARLDELCGGLETLGAGGALAGARAMLDALRAEGSRVRDALLALKS